MKGATVFYLIQNLSDLPGDPHWLSAGEHARVAGFRFPKRRNDWILGRWTAKRALRSFLIQTGRHAPAYPEIEIRSAADGAPEPYMLGSPAPVALALSHSGELGFCAVAAPDIALGCDLEIVQTRDTVFIHDYLCDTEMALVSSAPAERQPLITTLIWSAKESALKCLREGLRRDTRSVLVSLSGPGGSGWNRMTVLCRESSQTFYGWWRSSGERVQTIAADILVTEPLQLPLAVDS